MSRQQLDDQFMPTLLGPEKHELNRELDSIRHLLSSGRLAVAQQRCEKLQIAAKAHPDVWLTASIIASLLQNPSAARDYLYRAVTLAPFEPGLLIQVGQRLLSLGFPGEAIAVARNAEKLLPCDPQLSDALGTLLTHAGDAGRALSHFDDAVRGAPTNMDFRYNLAMAQRMNGDLVAAESNLDRIIAVRPHDGEAYNARSNLRIQTASQNHIPELRAALAAHRRSRASIGIEFALAKELEDLDEYDDAFAHLQHACRTCRSALQYDVQDDVRVLDSLRETHSSVRLSTLSRGYESDESVFIFGLPRSGTTLVERILGCHSQVCEAGELESFPHAAIRAVKSVARHPVDKLEFVKRALEVNFADLGKEYIESTRPRTGHRPKFTDKLPLNYLYAGLIHAALPNARLILVRRHPLDNCYAMYKTLFGSAYPFSYDLSDLAHYYVAWHRLMQHWESVLSSALLCVEYEDLVADQKKVSRRIVEHCRLPWEEGCLDFHRNSAAVATASAVQVRQPIYSRSVGRWRAYANQLDALASHLRDNHIECD